MTRNLNPRIRESLTELRERWEGDRELVKHFVLVKDEAVASLVREVYDGEFYYEFLRYFRLGDEWGVSVDKRDVKADEMLAYIAGYPCEG